MLRRRNPWSYLWGTRCLDVSLHIYPDTVLVVILVGNIHREIFTASAAIGE